MADKKISIIVPVYNASAYLDRCMESLLNQTLGNEDYEIILVNDGSKDNSGEICDSYSEKNENVLALHQDNAGPAAARNAGLLRAMGKYVAFIDPDDRIENNYLEIACAQGERYDADIVLFDAYREKKKPDGPIQESWGHAKYSFFTKDEKEMRSMQRQIIYPYMAAKVQNLTFDRAVPLAAPWDKIYKRSFLSEKNLKFPGQLRVLDDMCFNFKAFGEAKSVAYIPCFLYHYMVEETSITNSYRADRVEKDREVFEYLRNAINDMGLDKDEAARFRQALYCRIIKSFAISLRLYFFNPQNPKTADEIDRELKACLNSMPYKLAFKGVFLRNLEPKLVAVAAACKMKSTALLRFLFKLQYR